MNPKFINSMNARLARLEALLENSDVFKAQGGTTYGGLQYQGSQYNYNFEALDSSGMLDQQLMQNYGFGPSDMAIFELQQRIAELELLVAGGSNDTFQGAALDAGQAVGDDGIVGTGTVSEGTADIGVAFLGSVTGVTPVNGVTASFALDAEVDSNNAWSGTGYTAPSDGYYLCIGDVSGAENTAFPSSFQFALTQTGSVSKTYNSQAEQAAGLSPNSLAHNVTMSAVFSCARGDVLSFEYTATGAGTIGIDFARLSVIRTGNR